MRGAIIIRSIALCIRISVLSGDVIGGDESPAEMDPVEMDKAIFRERIGGIIEAVDEELRNPVKKPRAVSYISLAGE